MICPNCRIEVEGDRCPRCGARFGKAKEPRDSSGETSPDRPSMRTTLVLVWEALKITYSVIVPIVLVLLLIVGLMLLVSWCAEAP